METDLDQRDEHVETSLTPGHPCRQCPEGTYEKGTVTETLERGDTVVVVKDVPALVCDVCGNSLLAEEEVERLQRILEQAEAQSVELQSRRYQPLQEVGKNC
jgi:YgiT-type zinc finger domain-containing protein